MTFNKITAALLAAGTLSFAGGDIAPVEPITPVAPAAKNWYVGGHTTANQVFADRDWFSTGAKNSTTYGLGINGGYVFYRNGGFDTAIEGRVTYTFMGTDSELWTGDIMLKPKYTFEDFYQVAVYGLVGYTYADYDFDFNFNSDTSVDGLVWGGGLSYAINDEFEVFGDYTVRPEFNTWDNEVVTIGVNYKF